jgi:methylated-DNA-protein-cysteine methyltransferase-like protein
MHFAENMPMEDLLRAEGVEVKQNRVVNFEGLFWDPMVECELD